MPCMRNIEVHGCNAEFGFDYMAKMLRLAIALFSTQFTKLLKDHINMERQMNTSFSR